MGWLKGGFPQHEAYLERAGMQHRAGAFLQARQDARAAVDAADALAQVPLEPPASACANCRFYACLTVSHSY